MRPIDLRSDTVTQPTSAMRRAMASAEVGDDCYGEDPTVRRLEEVAAARLGKESALLVPSGTMANLAALLTHCERGQAIVCGDTSHIVRSELGGAATLGGLTYRTVPNLADGTLDERDLAAALAPGGDAAGAGVVCLENTHNYCAGAALSPAATQSTARAAADAGVPLHLDGARIFNAALAQHTTVAELAAPATSVSFCLSKGLGAPVGSLLCGGAAFIARARQTRRMLGGAMRQAGVFAAAGIVALDEMVERLAGDHETARRLAAGLADIRGLRPLPVATNIVIVEVSGIDGATFVRRLRDAGVLCMEFGAGRVRFVTHNGIVAADIERALVAASSALDAAA